MKIGSLRLISAFTILGLLVGTGIGKLWGHLDLPEARSKEAQPHARSRNSPSSSDHPGKDTIGYSASSRLESDQVDVIAQESATVLSPDNRKRALEEATVTELRIAYYDKLDSFRKNWVESRFIIPKTESDKNEQINTLKSVLRNRLGQDSRFYARSKIQANGKTYPAHLLIHLYNGTDYKTPLIETDLSKNDLTVCYSLMVYFEGVRGNNSAGSGSCLEHLMKRNGDYYYTVDLGINEIEPYLQQIAVSFPLFTDQTAVLEGFFPKESKWKRIDQISWEPISESRYNELLTEYGQWDVEE